MRGERIEWICEGEKRRGVEWGGMEWGGVEWGGMERNRE
jgi:hypothetical protein